MATRNGISDHAGSPRPWRPGTATSETSRRRRAEPLGQVLLLVAHCDHVDDEQLLAKTPMLTWTAVMPTYIGLR